MTEPTYDAPQQLDIGDIANEMESDPLSKALWERAQLKIVVRQFAAREQLLRERIAELETQHPQGPAAHPDKK